MPEKRIVARPVVTAAATEPAPDTAEPQQPVAQRRPDSFRRERLEFNNPLPFMEKFLDELANGESPRSPEYIRPVRVSLVHFSNWIRANTEVQHPAEITRDDLLRYQAHVLQVVSPVTGKPYSEQYRFQLMKNLRTWINWMLDCKYIDENPWVRIRMGKLRKKPKPVEVEDLAALFAAHRAGMFQLPPFVWHRRGVILALLYGWGLRIHELQSLNMAQIADPNLEWVNVRNKGGGTKRVPYSPAIKAEVQRWLPRRAEKAILGEDALIVDQSGGRLSIGRIRAIVTELGERAGVRINPHRLRDTFATTMIENDVPIEQIMAVTGHTTREMVLAYARIGDANVKRSHERAINPVLEVLLSGRAPSPVGGAEETA